MRKEYYSRHPPSHAVNDGYVKILQVDGGTETSLPPELRFLYLWPWISHGVLISITVLFLTLWAMALSMHDAVLYSPANEAIESIGIVRFDLGLTSTSIYRGPPSPEINAAWDRIAGDARPVRMTLDQLLRIREKPSPSMARYRDEDGGAYIATVEVIHQLQCIDKLRRLSWRGKVHNDDASEAFQRSDIDQCIELLRQNIMCHSDVTMITYDWVEGRKDPFPNFNVLHQCRDFEKVLDWVDEHYVFVPPSKMVRLEDNVDLPSPP
ncbi:hypothetical protein K503DRAFT_765137 [Rhizopogon vinicolor AM-OR11-026]|uniref:Uncharacterized protein n=1 Tax=Rhizopogon vinicolor AM-OR11-026 TaxID=1314800 RepID=A0A1B7NHD5_9AGAM|nr:hypothetical protein K503DRAFT_765137 [Rhizopogon vinicolor AM-OR11-026]